MAVVAEEDGGQHPHQSRSSSGDPNAEGGMDVQLSAAHPTIITPSNSAISHGIDTDQQQLSDDEVDDMDIDALLGLAGSNSAHKGHNPK